MEPYEAPKRFRKLAPKSVGEADSMPLGQPGTTMTRESKKVKKVMDVVESESANSEEGEEEEELAENEENSEEECSESCEEVSMQEKPRRKVMNAQMSARQFLARTWPSFSGKFDVWLLFISSYETSMKVCDFSDVENLTRL